MSDEKDRDWEMPKPVFRSTDGSVPRNLEDTISLSFAPNKEQVDIDADDDILGIMEAKYSGETDQHTERPDNDSILETEEVVGNTATPENIGSDPVVASPPTSRMNEAAHDEIPQARQIDTRKADFLTYIAMVVIGVGLIIAAIFYYFWPPPPVR